MLYGMWAVVWYMGCWLKGCSICVLLNGICALVGYVGCCMVCGLL